MGLPNQSVHLKEMIQTLVGQILSRAVAIDGPLKRRGESIISVYQDSNFGLNFQNFREARDILLHDAIEDLAGGASMLSQSALVTTFVGGSLSSQPVAFGAQSNGVVVFSISLKQSSAFRGWTRDQAVELLPEEDAWPAIYRLIVYLAKGQ